MVARSKEDWEEAALQAIAARGLETLSIPEMARSLGVTKGSFYWHFRSLKELIEAALHRWRALDQTALDEISRIANARERLIALFRQAMEKTEAHALYIAMSTVPEAAPIVRSISDRRLKFLIDSYRELGFTRANAQQQALLAYAAYVGALHLRLASKREMNAFVAHAVRALIPRPLH
jgi:AcrR family transcriptional regulator